MSLLLLALVAFFVSLTFGLPTGEGDGNHFGWSEFVKKHNRYYASLEDEMTHLKAFANSKKLVEAHNAAFERGEVSFKLGLTPNSDMTADELQKRRGLRTNLNGMQKLMDQQMKTKHFSLNGIDIDKLPVALDWRLGNESLKLVSEVKDQGYCGSCWAFSTVGTLEATNARLTGRFVELSEQNLVDCDFTNAGCDGGYPIMALEFTINEHGLNTEKAYTYKGSKRKCQFNQRKPMGAKDITGVLSIPYGSELALQAAVATLGPVSVAIDAGQYTFDMYHSGIYIEERCGNKLDNMDHAVLVVGYGTDPKDGDYWIVKNSWGTKWGENGYIRMARNRNNMCGIATLAVVPTP